MSYLPIQWGPFIAIGGIILLLTLIVQMLIGYRKIKFKGLMQMKVHRWLAWIIALSAAAHGLAGILYVSSRL